MGVRSTFQRSGVSVALEGLDGSGKSTVASQLAAHLPATLLSTSVAVRRDVRQVCDARHGDKGLSRQLFYAYGVSITSDHARSLRLAGVSVVIDRYWSTTIAYPMALEGASARLTEVERSLLCPDLTVFLDVPAEVRRARMTARSGPLTSIDRASIEQDAALRSTFLRVLRETPSVGHLLHLEGAPTTSEVIDRITHALSRLPRHS